MTLNELAFRVQQELEMLSGKVESVEMENLNLPDLKLPRWPEEVNLINIKLGKKKILMPNIGPRSGLLILRRRWVNIEAGVLTDGSVSFRITESVNFLGFRWEENERYIFSCGPKIDRIFFLIIFYQVKEELCAKVIEHLKSGASYHNKIIQQVKIIFQLFVPEIVLDKLAED